MSVRVLVADDHRIFRSGLRSLLESQPDLDVVGEVSDGRAAVDLVRETVPDVVLMDLSMPEMNGVEATRRICEERLQSKVLCLSMHAEREFVDSALKAGASGYLLKDCAAEELFWAIRVVVEGRVYLSPDIAGTVLEGYRAGGARSASSSTALLSGREREVLQLIAEGFSLKEIAARLKLSAKTISTHRENLTQKLGIRSVAGLTKYAIREGLTSVAR